MNVEKICRSNWNLNKRTDATDEISIIFLLKFAEIFVAIAFILHFLFRNKQLRVFFCNMSYWSKVRSLTGIAIGSGVGVGIYLYLNRSHETLVSNSWTTNTIVSPEAKWDFNWDQYVEIESIKIAFNNYTISIISFQNKKNYLIFSRNPASLVKPLKSKGTPEEENKYNERLEAVKPTSVRHLILIRHGQYNLDGATDLDRYLTEIGRKQAAFTGERLKLLQIPFDKMIRSTMTRAQETGKIISTIVANIPIENCSLIEEGAPGKIN